MLIVVLLPLSSRWAGLLQQASWYVVIALAISLHLPQRNIWLLSIFAGCCSGAMLKSPQEGAIAVLIFLAGLLIGIRVPVLAKIISGWLAAVALLSISLEYLAVSPGYVPDHLD